MQTIFVIIVLCAIAAFAYYAYVAAQRRKTELWTLAVSWAFSWDGDDPFGIEDKYEAFSALSRGHSRHAYNVFHGDRNGRATICFDYRYKTGSGKSQSTHELSGAIIRHGYLFPHLLVRPEGFLDKVAEFVGLDDIDFESAEFSRTFYVKCENRKFAFDIFHGRAMEYMLAQPRKFSMEFRGGNVLVTNDSTWSPQLFESAIAQVEGLLAMMPEYLVQSLHKVSF